MNKLIKKVLASDENALNSIDTFAGAARKLGYTQQEIDAALDQLDDFPLDDDQLEDIAGGFATVKAPCVNTTKPKQYTPTPLI